MAHILGLAAETLTRLSAIQGACPQIENRVLLNNSEQLMAPPISYTDGFLVAELLRIEQDKQNFFFFGFRFRLHPAGLF